MISFIGDAAFQAVVDAAVNRDLKNMMSKIQEIIFNTQRADPQGLQGARDPHENQGTQGDSGIIL